MSRLVIIFSFFLLLGCLLNPRPVRAAEGRFTIGNGSVGCEGISIWRDAQYRITGRCQGLVYPYGDGFTTYSLWVNPAAPNGTPRRVDDIDLGIIDGRVQEPFSNIWVTAEREGSPRQPAGVEIVSGGLEPFHFRSGSTFGQALGATAAPAPLTPAQTPTPTPIIKSGGITLPGIFTAIPLTLIIIVVAVFLGILLLVRRMGA